MDNKYNINLETKNSCSCGGHHHDGNNHSCCSHKSEISTENISEDETAFINNLLSYRFLPVARLVLKSTKESDFIVHTLSPVYIEYKDDSMDKVRFVSEILNSLEEKGIITIDYDIKLKNYDYNEYYDSDLYKYFVKTVEEGKNQKDFLGDTPELETGSIAITEKYMELISQ